MGKRKPTPGFFVLLSLCVALGCAGRQKTAQPIFKGEPKASPEAGETLAPSSITVSPIRSDEGPFQHPFALNEAKLEGLLRALYFQKRATLTWKKPERVLNNMQAAALAREISPVFSSLGKDELVRFRLTGEDGETTSELFVAQDCLNFRILTIQGYDFIKKGAKATSHQWKLTPHAGQGFFPSTAVLWNPKEATNWIVVRLSDLAPTATEQQAAPPDDQPLIHRLDVFP